MTIKLSEALKLQRKIILSQKANQRTVILNNSYVVDGSVIYRIKTLEEEQQNLKQDLIVLKMAIRNANESIAEDIFMLSELKEELKRFEKISVKEGTYLEKESNKTVTYAVHFSRSEIKEKLKNILASIREIEAKLNNHNKITELKLDFKSNLLSKTNT